ncbi:MAG: gamma-glutamylcyclotransferase [Aquificaceae bacterium]|nr:gamma-glutamylcyclotransferase [Aquificaceae bacterium]
MKKAKEVMGMFYFAYGSNMNLQQMKERCSNSAEFLKRAYLEGYKFVYDGYSSTRNGSVANIVKEEGSVVWGALYRIDEDCLKKLDEYEGYPKFYRRDELIVKDDYGNEYKAWVYLRKPQGEGKPSKKYMNIVVIGAIQCGLPEHYIMEYLKVEAE